ncbi:MAG: hypothetical protein M1827_002070 [Pycnora praestabilis]|nr:MAG: hypothetical protein M1827_002070 [Pycnora praestabilis]
MSEFIGSRISLVSKSDIRYVGTLHEINSETSTVALEQVVSYGTEGRRNKSEDEIAPSDSVYEYIVFRGSDVKDLRIEEPPKENKPPPVPNDPAILGSGSRPPPQAPPQAPPQGPAQNQQPRQGHPPHFQQQQQPPFPYYYPPPSGQRFGPPGGPQGGFPQGPNFPGMPYGAPPGWYPPPGQGFPHPPGPFSPHQMPIGPSGQQQQQGPKQPRQAPIGSAPIKEQKRTPDQVVPEKQEIGQPSTKSATPTPAQVVEQAPTPPPPPMDSKPDVTSALAPPTSGPTITQAAAASKPAPTGPRGGRIVPVVPLPSPNIKGAAVANGPLQANSGNIPQPATAQPSQAAANAAIQNATQAATAAVAAAMAKLPPAPGQKQQQGSAAVDNLTKKVDEMRTNDNIRTSRQPGTGGYAAGHRGRGGRGTGRADNNRQQGKKVEVPDTDYDFESANAKFNKQDLVKEAIASGSPVGTPGEALSAMETLEPATNGSPKDAESIIIPPASYNKSSSFFDNISSEMKDRDEANGTRPGGREWRGEETKKNLETFGQGSVDNGYRGGFRGRGRGRGAGRGRAGYAQQQGYRGGRGGYRGGRGGSQAGNGVVSAES